MASAWSTVCYREPCQRRRMQEIEEQAEAAADKALDVLRRNLVKDVS